MLCWHGRQMLGHRVQPLPTIFTARSNFHSRCTALSFTATYLHLFFSKVQTFFRRIGMLQALGRPVVSEARSHVAMRYQIKKSHTLLHRSLGRIPIITISSCFVWSVRINKLRNFTYIFRCLIWLRINCDSSLTISAQVKYWCIIICIII